MTAPPAARRACIAVLVAAILAYFFWTAVCSFDEVPRIRSSEHREGDHYNLLSRGFLKGQLSLDAEVPAALLAAANPYDPQSRGRVEVLHDASLYRGKYYIYFGPAPVVTLFLPFTVLTGRDLPVPYAVFAFGSGAFLVLVATFLFVQRRHFPQASMWAIGAGIAGLGGASMIVALLRRPHIWEVAGASGLFYFSLALFCLVRALHSPRAVRWTAAGGLALGLAVASRPTWLVCSVLFGLPLLMRPRRGTERDPYDWRALATAAVTCTTIVLGLFIYNYARFENPLEFGQKHQLSSIIEGDARHFSAAYVLWNLEVYFLSPLRWTPTFPFHHGIAHPPPPPGFGGYEYSFGLLTNVPFSLFALVVPAALLRRRCRDLEDKRRRAALAVVAGAAFLAVGVLAFFFGNCVRYMSDFAPWIALLAAFGIVALETRLASRPARIALRAAAIVLALLSTGASAAGIVRIYHPPERPPAAYLPVARALNYPTFLFRQLRAPDFQAQELTAAFPADRTPRRETLLAVRRDHATTAELLVEYLGDDRLRFAYREAGRDDIAASPVIAPPAGLPVKLQVSLGADYEDFDGHRSRLRVQVDDWPLWDVAVISLDAIPGRLAFAPPDSATRFSGELRGQRAIVAHNFAPPRLGGGCVRLTLTPDMAGRSFPLLTSGRRGAGDLLFLRVDASGRTTLGYDHWADRLRFSAELPTAFGRPYVFEFWIPPATPTFNARGDRRLLVRLDGATVWDEPVPWFPVAAEDIHVGANPIGGSTCETVLVNGIIERTQVPYPAGPATSAKN